MFTSLLLRLPALPVVANRLARLARLARGLATTALQDALSWVMDRTTDRAVRALFHRRRTNPTSTCLRLTAPYWRFRSWTSEPEEYRYEAAWEAHAAGEDPADAEGWTARRLLADALRDLVAPTRCRDCRRPLWYADSWCPCWAPAAGPLLPVAPAVRCWPVVPADPALDTGDAFCGLPVRVDAYDPDEVA